MGNDDYIDWRETMVPFQEVPSAYIIRCKDCKYYQEIEDFTGYTDCVHPRGLDGVGENDFCSYGEEKEVK